MSFKRPILFYLCLFCLFIARSQSHDINFTSLRTKDGLSSNSVNAIIKDKEGLIWFGTEDGLDKFDGTNFTIYRHKQGDSTTLQANEILSLHEDRNGDLWVGTSGGSLSLYDRKKDLFINFPSGGNLNAITNNVINGIGSDYQGRIWIATYTGVNILDPKTKKVSNFPLGPGNSETEKIALCITEDSRHQMWIGTTEGLFRYNPKDKALVHFLHSAKDPSSLADNYIHSIAEDSKGNLWVATSGGLNMLKAGSEKFITYNHNNNLSSDIIYSISIDDDKLWLGTEGGLNILDPRTGDISIYKQDYRNIHSLTAKAIHCVYIDKQGIYWLGTYRGGVDKYDRNLNLFNYVEGNAFDQKGLNTSIVTSFAENTDGKIYVGTEGLLTLFDRKTNSFQHVNIRSKGKNGPIILSMAFNAKKQLLIGTFSDGLYVLNSQSGSYQQYVKGAKAEDLNSDDIFSITLDRNGNTWLGTNGGGVNILNSENKVIRRYTPNPTAPNDIKLPINGYIRDIAEDGEGNMWIGTHGGGIAVLEPVSGKFTIYTSQNSKLPNDKVIALLEDSKGNMWSATFGGGIGLFNKSTRQFTTFSEKDGLQNNTVYSIIEDNNGLIWVSTNKGISSIDITSKKINNYNFHNGIQNNNFVHKASLRLSDGELFFGGLDGFNYFNPKYLKKNNNIPPVVITDLKISNRSTSPTEDGPITENISIAKEINLDYKQNFALSFVALNYTSSEQNQYAYKLEGFDKDWNYIGSSTTASYTNLDPGEYVFHVKASNNNGVWNNAGTSIRIYVHPPFWRTTLAYLIYLLAIIGIVFYLRYKSLQKLHRRFALEQERLHAEHERKQAERIHELDQQKIKFLTNLSHEFRTPISLILGPVDTLIAKDVNEKSAGQLHMIRRNARRLLNLVNQLLDFRKMEEQELKLQPAEGDLVSFAKEVTDSFRDLSERKKIQFEFVNEIEHLHTSFDHDKIERILFNILSNAFKFTAAGGKISLHLTMVQNQKDSQHTWISFKISDTGIGIPADKKEKIFERFFQNSTVASILNQGTGIGLSIAKEFVEMQGGTIEVESEPGIGTTFLIHLPFIVLETAKDLRELTEETEAEIHLIPLEEKVEQHKENAGKDSEDVLPSILLVEDNDDFRFYLKDNLALHYKVYEAADGKEGWHQALANHPQIIVSDVSMPVMDGIEFCKKIKSDKRTNHIPVILLTALTREEDQIRGLETGANDYVTKPFNFEVLNAKIKNLLTLNNSLRHTYSKQIKVVTPEVEIESDDEKLLRNITVYLEENLNNQQLSVEELSKHVGMSRSSLYSKLLELTGQTPVEYIRSVKLDKAAVLLEKSNMNIAQVAYSVGFSTPNYFAKSFKAKFNMLPSEYINKKKAAMGKKNVES